MACFIDDDMLHPLLEREPIPVVDYTYFVKFCFEFQHVHLPKFSS